MSDLISRQAAIDAMEESKRIYVDRRVIIGKMQDIVSNLPSAQPEIIRCKDCGKQPVCRFSQFQGNDGYCGLAERKGER